MLKTRRLLLILALAPLALVPGSAAEVYVENDRRYVGDDGSLHIVGEIHNGLDYAINQVSVRAGLISDSGDRVGTADAASPVRTVPPGMRAPFDIVFPGGPHGDAAGYALDLDYRISAPKSRAIEIVDSELRRDGLDNLMIAGTVANNGEITANTVSVVATLYDRDGNVAVVSRSQAGPDYLRSNDVAHFIVPVPDRVQADRVVGYSLVAESEEYAAVPEFPLGSGLLLAGSVGAYVALTRILPARITGGLAPAAGSGWAPASHR